MRYYRDHPLHVEYADHHFRPIAEDRLTIDFRHTGGRLKHAERGQTHAGHTRCHREIHGFASGAQSLSSLPKKYLPLREKVNSYTPASRPFFFKTNHQISQIRKNKNRKRKTLKKLQRKK